MHGVCEIGEKGWCAWLKLRACGGAGTVALRNLHVRAPRSAMTLLTPPVLTPAARQATQEYIDWLENDKKRSARPADFEVQREREETARQKIAALLGESVADQGALEAADTFLSSLQSEPAAR